MIGLGWNSTHAAIMLQRMNELVGDVGQGLVDGGLAEPLALILKHHNARVGHTRGQHLWVAQPVHLAMRSFAHPCFLRIRAEARHGNNTGRIQPSVVRYTSRPIDSKKQADALDADVRRRFIVLAQDCETLIHRLVHAHEISAAVQSMVSRGDTHITVKFRVIVFLRRSLHDGKKRNSDGGEASVLRSNSNRLSGGNSQRSES